MDYKIGSLADLISGNKTPNNTKVIQKSFTPIKKEPVEDSSDFEVSKKTNNEKSKMKLKSPKNEKVISPEVTHVDMKDKSIKRKAKKRKVDTSNMDLADSDAEQSSPKIRILSKNEQNAAGRIKNKINKDTKNSSEYKEKYKEKTVFVGNIPISVKKEKVKKLFRKYGDIETVRIRGIPVADPKTTKKVAAITKEFHPDRNTVYAYIRFKNAEDAKKAEAENGELFHDHHLRVHCCESDEKPNEAKAIFIGNLAFSAEEEELWQLFKPCGPISHVRIVRDGRTAMSKGFGYVNFKDADSVQLALEMEKVVLKNRELRISACDSSRAQKKKTPKKPRHRNRKPDTKNENGDVNNSTKKKKTFRVAKMNPAQFRGSKFDDKKKKRKFDRTALEKKKLAQKLVAPKLSIQ